MRDPGELLEENVMSKPKPDSVYKMLTKKIWAYPLSSNQLKKSFESPIQQSWGVLVGMVGLARAPLVFF